MKIKVEIKNEKDMALIKCPECGGKISDKSDKCIHCGYPLKLMKKSKNRQPSNSNEPCLLETMMKEREEMENMMDNVLNRHQKIDLMSMTLPVGWYF